MATKRQRLSIEDKWNLIQAIDKGVPRVQLMKDFNLKHQSNISMILNKRTEIEQQMEKGVSVKVKTIRSSKFPMIDKDLRDFVADMNTRGGTVPHSLLKEKAKDLAVKYQVQDEFMASDGYLQKFMKRQGIACVTSAGDAANVDQIVVSAWKATLPSLIQGYSASDVFNCDELGLFFKLTPSRTYAVKGESFRTGKNSKERVTLLLAANMSGTEKLPPLMIGKSEKPRCFNKIKRKPIAYRWNRKAWMTSVLFEEWLHKFDFNMKNQKRKILLFMDNCSAHSVTAKLTHVKVLFLPANTTSVLQPLDQGIIKCFKCFYRKRLVRHLLSELEANKDKKVEEVKIDLLLASKWTNSAWNDVTEATVRNCFRKAGFRNEEEEEEAEIEFPSLEALGGETVSTEEFLGADDSVCVSGSHIENIPVQDSARDDDQSDDEEEDEVVAQVEPSNSEAMRALLTLKSFMLFKDNNTQDKSFDQMDDFIHKCIREGMVQTKISDVFPVITSQQ